jgi:hypothetical protein
MKGSSFQNSLSKSTAVLELKEWDNAFHLLLKWHRSYPKEDIPPSKLSEKKTLRDKEKE